ncbi:NADH dehydrogenase [ubiquinone] 1 alpha subcomplex subunit 13-like [Watersipora subatra]|uniref:NADH dehydrogenase [ubiquinone] 1 alpha subcomplex subunit 13-like n=1 Tax=Watersipora subatra TaxID=2589382 RepID=UPI00355AE55F
MATYKQDMPPSGGYHPYDFVRRVKPRLISGKFLFLGFAAWTTAALAIHRWGFKKNVIEPELENREAHIAMEPILLAERNRHYLKQLVRNREAEKEIMKDVPGWVPGTFYGTPIYYRKGVWDDLSIEEYYAHSQYEKGYHKEVMERHWH